MKPGKEKIQSRDSLKVGKSLAGLQKRRAVWLELGEKEEEDGRSNHLRKVDWSTVQSCGAVSGTRGAIALNLQPPGSCTSSDAGDVFIL